MKARLIAMFMAFVLSAPDARSNTYIGSGRVSCGDWLASSESMRVHRQNWIMGYLSGLNSNSSEPITAECLVCLAQNCPYPTIDFLAEHTANGITAAIDKYCRENPLKKVIDAADDVAGQMKRLNK
jgi:hypothetical protein